MPILKLSNGEIVEQTSKIQQQLACLQVSVNQIFVENDENSWNFPEFSTQDVLSYAQKEEIILSYKTYFQNYLENYVDSQGNCHHLTNSYNSESHQSGGDRFFFDLLSLHPGSPHLYSLTKTYGCYHTHTDAEILHILCGQAIFGFLKPDGSQLELLLQPGECIYIPPECEHYFSLTASLQCQAVRYFSTANGWIPRYTNRLQLDI